MHLPDRMKNTKLREREREREREIPDKGFNDTF